MQWRDSVGDADRDAVLRLVRSTGFFSPEEEAIAVELVDEALALGTETSGYEFVFADAPGGDLLGYACFGPIPGRPGAFDLYWIAVAPSRQRAGLGRQLIVEAERRAARQGATDMFIDTAGRDQYRPTRDFYERMGYSRHETIRNFYSPGDDKVVYHKRLTGAVSASGGSPPTAGGGRKRRGPR